MVVVGMSMGSLQGLVSSNDWYCVCVFCFVLFLFFFLGGGDQGSIHQKNIKPRVVLIIMVVVGMSMLLFLLIHLEIFCVLVRNENQRKPDFHFQSNTLITPHYCKDTVVLCWSTRTIFCFITSIQAVLHKLDKAKWTVSNSELKEDINKKNTCKAFVST